jgi:hypothetical protein
MITNIYIRIFLGTWSIIIGIVLGKMYLDRDKDNWFGKFYRNSNTINWEKNLGINPKYTYIILSLLAILMGIIVLLFGVRKTLVGVP